MNFPAETEVVAARRVLVIPTLDPGEEFVPLVKRLAGEGCALIVVVDDGSASRNRHRFDLVEPLPGVVVLRHDHNLGKGAALKTGFRYVLRHAPAPAEWLVTLDADGQHRVEDVLAIADREQGTADCLVLGVREFSGAIPWRSRFGNHMTRRVLRWTSGIDVRDSQTGLRSLPLRFAAECLAIEANRYEFELEYLLLAKRRGLLITQHPISTIYLDENIGSHFRPITDSFRIYWALLRSFW